MRYYRIIHFEKLAVFRSPYCNGFSEFELILSPFNGPVTSFSRKCTACMQCSCAMRWIYDAMMMMMMIEQTIHTKWKTKWKGKKLKQKIKYCIYEIPNVYIRKLSVEINNERNACMHFTHSFIHFESNEMIYSYRLWCTMQILVAAFEHWIQQ